jgi:hypothetical protein
MINLAGKCSWRKFKYINLIVQSLINIYYRKVCIGERDSCRNMRVDIAELEHLTLEKSINIHQLANWHHVTPHNTWAHIKT